MTWNSGTGQVDQPQNWTLAVEPNEADTLQIWSGNVLAPGDSPPDLTIDIGNSDAARVPTFTAQSGTLAAGVLIQSAVEPASFQSASGQAVVAHAIVAVQGNTVDEGTILARTIAASHLPFDLSVTLDASAMLTNQGVASPHRAGAGCRS